MFARKTVTLSFEGSAVRVLATRGREVLWWTALDFPPEHMAQGEVRDPQAVANALAELFERHRFPRKRTVSSIPGTRTISRIMELPPLRKRQLDSTIHLKVKQEIALPIEETDLTWQILDHTREGWRVFVFAAPRSVIDRQVEALQAARIRIRKLDAKPLALARLSEGPTGILANLEPHALGIVLVADGIPALIRSVPLSSASESAGAQLDLLAQELARSVKFYNETHKPERLDPELAVLISGKTFSDPRNIEGFQSRIRRPVRSPGWQFKRPDGFSPIEYATNLGIVLGL